MDVAGHMSLTNTLTDTTVPLWAPLPALNSAATRITLDQLHDNVRRSTGDAKHLNILGLAYSFRYEYNAAQEYFEQAVTLQPTTAAFHYNLGDAIFKSGEISAANEHFLKSHNLAPNRPEPLLRLANIVSNDDQDKAIRYYCHAINLGAKQPLGNGSLPECLLRDSSWQEALNKVSNLLPRESATQSELAHGIAQALLNLGRLEELFHFCHRCPDLLPDAQDSALYEGYMHMREVNAAEAVLDRMISRAPSAHVSVIQLEHFRRFGDTDAASQLVRNSLPMLARLGRHFEGRPEWDGSPLNGKTLLLTAIGPHMGSGFGDVIHWARFWPFPKQLGGRVIVLSSLQIKPLFLNTNVDQICCPYEGCDHFDVFFEPLLIQELSCMDLPTTGALVPYASSPEHKRQIWRRHFHSSSRLRVGIAWRSGGVHNRYRDRNISLDELRTIFAIPGTDFYGLQPLTAGESADAMNVIGTSLPMLEDTAAAMSELDVVVTVDTVFAHLAGALGRPTLIMLPYFAGARWLMDRQDCPFYPSVRLFRQTQPGIWADVIAAVKLELEAMRDSKGNLSAV